MKERILVLWRNWRNRHVAKAHRILCDAMKRDKSFAQAWQSYIAIAIYDELTSSDHKVKDAASNRIANKLMHHLFEVSE